MAIQYVQHPVKIIKSAGSSATLTEETGTTADNRIVTIKTVTDDGAGNLGAGLGTVSYLGKTFSLKVVDFGRSTSAWKSDHEDAKEFDTVAEDGGGSSGGATARGGTYGTASIGEEVFAGSSLVARYRVGASSPTAKSMSFVPPAVVLDLTPYTTDRIVAGSVLFDWMGTVYQDVEGVLYRERTVSDPGIASGTIDYATGHALMTNYVVGGSGPTDFALYSLWTQNAPWNTASLFFCTDVAPLRAGPGGFVLTVVDTRGNTLTAAVDALGNITGTHMWGKIEFSRGQIELQFGDFVDDASLSSDDKAEWWYNAADVGAVVADKIWRPWPVDPTTLRYSAVSYIYLPVDVSLMGIDPAALPPDGRVAFARPGDTCVVGVTHGGSPFSPSLMTYNVGHERLSFVQVLDAATGAEIVDGFTADLDAGTVEFTDVSGYPGSIKVVARTEVYRQIAEVRIDGRVRLTQPIGTAFGTDAVFSTALRQGDRFARVSSLFDQQTWDGITWAEDVVGDPAPATYNAIDHPIELNNRGALTERWAIRFRVDATTFDLYGEHLGLIATGTKNADFSPLNSARGVPYFTLREAGWGGGWVAGNTLFFTTVGAEYPIDVVRCVQPSSPAGVDDSFWLVQRGDVGRPPEAP